MSNCPTSKAAGWKLEAQPASIAGFTEKKKKKKKTKKGKKEEEREEEEEDVGD